MIVPLLSQNAHGKAITGDKVAYDGAKFTNFLLRGLNGEKGVIMRTFVESPGPLYKGQGVDFFYTDAIGEYKTLERRVVRECFRLISFQRHVSFQNHILFCVSYLSRIQMLITPVVSLNPLNPPTRVFLLSTGWILR
jgi:hypothetical protein